VLRVYSSITAAVAITSGIIGVACKSSSPSCLAQLSSIGRASLLYAEANDGMMPPQVTFELSPIGARDETDIWIANLVRYGALKAYFRCPDDKGFGDESRESLFAGNINENTSYSVSLSFIDFGSLKGGLHLNVQKVTDPSKTAYVEDVVYVERVAVDEGVVVSAHGDTMNRWFLDGHAANSKIKKK